MVKGIKKILIFSFWWIVVDQSEVLEIPLLWFEFCTTVFFLCFTYLHLVPDKGWKCTLRIVSKRWKGEEFSQSIRNQILHKVNWEFIYDAWEWNEFDLAMLIFYCKYILVYSFCDARVTDSNWLWVVRSRLAGC